MPQIDERDEIILVEDCSTDDSRVVCTQIANQHHNIRLIPHSENRGLSEARNTGLQAAQGKYVTFIDSDDFLAPDTLDFNMKILEEHKDIDILEFPVEIDYGANTAHIYIPAKGQQENYSAWLRRRGYRHSYAWNKIYRRTLWQDIKFPLNRYVEDLFTIPYIMERAKLIYASDKGRYYYCKRKKSICGSANTQFYYDHLDASVRLFQHIRQGGLLTQHQTDVLYAETANTQITYRRNGGKEYLLPTHKISFSSILTAKTGFKTRIKMIMLWLHLFPL